MTDTTTLIQRIKDLTARFGKGWHDGIQIDASDIADLCLAGAALEQQAAQIEALRADAARYAFIRARWTHCTFAWNKDSANSLKSIGLTIKTACPVKASSSSLDREIDAALRQARPTKGEGA